MKIYCTNCEHKCDDADEVCPGCGHRLAKFVRTARHNNKNTRLLLAFIAAALSIGAVVKILNDEVDARVVVAEATKIRAQAQGQFEAVQRYQRAMLERISDTRRDGGFTSDESRIVQGRAANAMKKFTRLSEEDVLSVFGIFGDQDFSYEELVNLAILKHLGKIGVEVDYERFDRELRYLKD